MTNISSYVDYLPSVLRSQDSNPSQFLGRMLCIFEKILTGITIDAQVVRISATISNAINNRIQVTNDTDAAKFRTGDILTIEGTAERVRIHHILGTEIFLDSNLTSNYSGGIVRIADLTPGQASFCVSNKTGLMPGSIIKITQGIKSEKSVVDQVNENSVTLSAGLVNTYTMINTDVPVRIQDWVTIDAQVIRTRVTLVNTVNMNKIQVKTADDAANFRAGDIITIKGTTERVRIDHLLGEEIFLDANLTSNYSKGIVCIADIIPGQTAFRVDNTTGLGPGSIIKITQGIKSEKAVVEKVTENFVTLSNVLVNTYLAASMDSPIKIKGALQHDDFEKIIDELSQIFNPWSTRSGLLPWLASWVALTLREDWSEYQKRKLIAEMSSIYQLRGLKDGLRTYLDIYAATEVKPRIAIDDGDAIFRATFLSNGTAMLHAFAHSNTISQPDETVTVLLHPSGIASDKANNYMVADEGEVAFTKPPRQPALWKVSSTGNIDYTQGRYIPKPSPIHIGSPLKKPIAVVADSQNRFGVLDTNAIYRFPPDNYALNTVIDNSFKPTFTAVHPVDMILDSSENFIVLDRGSNSLTAVTKIVRVSEKPSLDVKEHHLRTVIEPTALVMDSEGFFIVADAKKQSTSEPADLIRFDPRAGWGPTDKWPGTSLLIKVSDNPLIYPTGIVFENSHSLLVCDRGIRGWIDDRTNRVMAEPAAIYRVDLSHDPPIITKVTYENKLVYPTKMMIDRKGKLIITDRGESNESIPKNWRAGGNEFGVVVHFSQKRPTTPNDRRRILGRIMNIIEEQKPGDTSYWMAF